MFPQEADVPTRAAGDIEECTAWRARVPLDKDVDVLRFAGVVLTARGVDGVVVGGRLRIGGAVRHASRPTANSRHSPGTPLSTCVPRSSNRSPDPATRSLTVLDTNTSPAPAR